MQDRQIELTCANIKHIIVSDGNLAVYVVITDNTKDDTQPVKP